MANTSLDKHLSDLLADIKGQEKESMTTETKPKEEKPVADSSKPIATDKVPQHIVSLDQQSPYGKRIRTLLEKVEPNPVVILSRPGSGKTQLLKLLGEELNYERVGVLFNAQSPAKVIFGNFYPPRSADKGQLLEWIDSRMVAAMRPSYECSWKDGQPRSQCICPKKMIHIDEFNRQEEDVQVRWLSVLEDTGRWMHLVEHHQEEFDVHPNVWVVGTMNPEEQSASINPIEPALLDRLRIIDATEKPLVNEKKVLGEILPHYPQYVDKLLKMAVDSRRNPETEISTRALIMVGKSIVYGMTVSEALKINVMNTTVRREHWQTMDSLYQSYFGMMEGMKLAPSKTGV